MLISEASLEELNARLNNPVHMDNFRPNLVATGCQAFDEVSVFIYKHTAYAIYCCVGLWFPGNKTCVMT